MSSVTLQHRMSVQCQLDRNRTLILILSHLLHYDISRDVIIIEISLPVLLELFQVLVLFEVVKIIQK